MCSSHSLGEKNQNKTKLRSEVSGTWNTIPGQRGDKGCRLGCILAKKGGSPFPSLNYSNGVGGVVDSRPISPLSFCVVERPKESIRTWGSETGPASQPRLAPATHLRCGVSSLQRLTMESFPGGSAVIDMILLRLRWGCCERSTAVLPDIYPQCLHGHKYYIRGN